MKSKHLIVLIACFLCSAVTNAQTSQVLFGKNRIQYKQFNWQFISTPNFDVYYYEGGKELADVAAYYAEAEFDRITNIIGYSPYTKTKLIIYNSIPDFQQTNIGLPYERYVIGGQTSFIKSRAMVAFNGTQAQFKKDISYRLAYNLTYEMIYGNSLKDIIQSSYFLSLPEWYISGVASYIAYGWSIEMDDFIRDAVTHQKFKKPANLIGRDAAMAGHSIWNYIAERYGTGVISTILNFTRISRNIEISLSNSVSTPYDIFIKSWLEYYKDMLQSSSEYFSELNEEHRFIKNRSKEVIYSQIKLSPDATKTAYSFNKNSKYQIAMRNNDSKKKKVLKRNNINNTDLGINTKVPLLVWKENDHLIAIEEKRGKIFLNSVYKKSGSKINMKMSEYTQVLSLDIDDSGNKLLISGVKNGKSDIFIYNFVTNKTIQVTNDFADDMDAKFINGTDKIVFSSNRKSDTLSIGTFDFKSLTDNFNIFIYDYKQKLGVATRISNHYGKETKPVVTNDETIYYLSEQNGVKNIFRYDTSYTEGALITNYLQNVKEFDIKQNTLIYRTVDDRKEKILLNKTFDGNEYLNSDLRTYRQELQDNKYFDKGLYIPLKNTTKTEMVIIDSTSAETSEKEPEDPDFVDINNYIFEEEKAEKLKDKKPEEKKNASKSLIGLLESRSLTKTFEVKPVGPYKYKKIMSLDRTLTSLYLDNLRGPGVLLEAGMTDMFENHRFYGGLFGILDLRSSNYYAEYSYLKKRIDIKASYLRQTLFYSDENNILKFNMNEYKISAVYPFTAFHSIRFSPFFTNINMTDVYNLARPNFVSNYVGYNTEFVMDNTKTSDLNIIQGTRFKLGYFTYYNPKTNKENFSRFNIDFRHYERIHKEITFAVRLAYGQFLGPSKKYYLMGGMDSWIFPQTNEGALPLVFTNPADLMFLSYATNLRGFKYNAKNGNNYVLANFELRFPIVKYFYRSPISSGFFRHLQFVGFFDTGSAWSGKNPFTKDNTLNTQVITSAPFTANVINYRNPFLYGYGVGMRTLMLGYYIKFDLAWGVEDYQTNRPKLHITLGYDF